MEEVKGPRNKLDIEVNVDTDEAQERIERLTQAAEKCTKAFEELGDAIANLGALIQVPDGKEIAKSLEKELAQLARYKGNV
ncbi:hypothetical protein ABHN09_10750 [Bacillus paramobilis]|uniref:hypothetical protein n=1 Tax=Bacillus paramobilis TaxID=2817477 RepID=UPI003D1F915F